MKTASLFAFAVAGVASALLPAHAQTVVNLGTASTFAALAGTTVTSTGLTVLNGNLGTEPGAAITGFGPGVVNGTTYAGGAVAQQARIDVITAYNAVSGQTATTTGATAFATTTLTPGVYNAAASLSLSGIVTLDGNNQANPVFVFQMGSTLLAAGTTQVVLINGARAENVYWRVGSSATLDSAAVFAGTIFANTSITLGSGVSVDGRLFAINGALSLIGNTVSVPVSAIPEPATTSLLVAGFFGLVIGARRFHQRRTAARATTV